LTERPRRRRARGCPCSEVHLGLVEASPRLRDGSLVEGEQRFRLLVAVSAGVDVVLSDQVPREHAAPVRSRRSVLSFKSARSPPTFACAFCKLASASRTLTAKGAGSIFAMRCLLDPRVEGDVERLIGPET